MSRRKSKKHAKPDEHDHLGHIEMARFGRVVVARSALTGPQHKKMMEELANTYDETVAEIDSLVQQIRDRVAEVEPLNLLQRSYADHFMHQIEVIAEVDAGLEEIIAGRMIDYVQSIIVSTPPTGKQAHITDKGYAELRDLVKALFVKLSLPFFMTQTAMRRRAGTELPEQLESLYVQLQMTWINVRGDRYAVHHAPHLRGLLAPHEDVISDLWGVSVENIVEGLESIRHNLSAGVGEALSEIQDGMEECFKHLGEADDDSAAVEGDEADPQAGMRAVAARLGLTEKMSAAADRAFGLTLFRVEQASDWPQPFLDLLSFAPGDDPAFFATGPFCGWPVRVWPVFQRPFLRVNGAVYCFDQWTVFDHAYRILQRAILRERPDYRQEWNRRQQAASERLPIEMLTDALPGSEVHQSVYYRAQDWCELDGLVIYNDVLFVVEVRAGALTTNPPTTDFEQYFENMKSLIVKPTHQAHRFIGQLEAQGTLRIYDADHEQTGQISADDFRLIVPMAVTVDSLGEAAAQSARFAALVEASDGKHVWSLSLDDLRVITEVLDRPGRLCHFIEQRLKAAQAEELSTIDEIDHLGMYLRENHYVEFFKSLGGHFGPVGYCEPIDRYYHQVIAGERPEPPYQRGLHPEFEAILEALEHSESDARIRAIAALLDLDGDARRNLGLSVADLRERGRARGRAQYLSMPMKHLGMTLAVLGPGYQEVPGRFRDEACGDLLRQEADERMLMLLSYDQAGGLADADCQFFHRNSLDADQLQRAERAAEMQIRRRAARQPEGKIGRNAPCPCLSGKKYKKCCGR